MKRIDETVSAAYLAQGSDWLRFAVAALGMRDSRVRGLVCEALAGMHSIFEEEEEAARTFRRKKNRPEDDNYEAEDAADDGN
ncbi:unnamed protein product, partial [Amoebophrya sp. A25]|eukprot:GSA25T00005871001.1